MRLDEIHLPTTPVCRAARDVATEYCSPALFNHSVRSYLWALEHARRHGIDFDDELLYVSAMLHDVGLVREFDNHTLPFEEAGGHVAWVLGAGAGWPVARRVRAARVIVAHMLDHVDVEADPEGHLLEHSTAIDISGRGVADVPAAFRAQVLERYPRLELVTEFTACFRDQANRKPDSLAAVLVRAGLPDRLAANPLNPQ